MNMEVQPMLYSIYTIFYSFDSKSPPPALQGWYMLGFPDEVDPQ
ncbi:hypothetical protein EMIT0P4_230058 [Pseudomonas sp. IT-P4]